VEKGAYKYYRLKLDDIVRSQFTIVLSVIKGKSALFHSFTNENPKSDSDFVTEIVAPDEEKPWIEAGSGVAVGSEEEAKQVRKVVAVAKDGTKHQQIYYQIVRPIVQPNSVLYFSVQGQEDTNNEFEVYVHDKIVLDPNSAPRGPKPNQILYIGVFFTFLAQFVLVKFYLD
jgi:hypothetical protein